MTIRTVTGTIKKPNGIVYGNAILTIALRTDIISSSIFVPKTNISVTTDSNGQFSVDLYVPDTGTAIYEIILSEGGYRLIFNFGSGSIIDLSELVILDTISVDPNYITELTSLNITYTAIDLQITAAHEYVWSDGTVMITLPATTGLGDVYFISNQGSGTITVAVTGSDTINGTTPLTIPTMTIAYYVDAEIGNWHSNW
jgi:hypothetical protein